MLLLLLGLLLLLCGIPSGSSTPDVYVERLAHVLQNFTPGKLHPLPPSLKLRRRATKEGKYIAIVTNQLGALRDHPLPGFKVGLTAFECYARRHGYTFVANTEPHPELEGMPDGAQFSKIFTLAKYIAYFDWVAWFDLDVMIKDTSVRLEDFLTKDFVCADAPDGNNNGIFMVRNCEFTFQALRRWLELRHTINLVGDNGPWMELMIHFVYEAAGRKYNGHCVQRAGGARNPDAGRYVRCYDQTMTEVGSPVGHRKQPNVNFVYAEPHGGFNSFWGWQGKNGYRPGYFLMHFAGMGPGSKAENVAKEAKPEWRNGHCESDVPPEEEVRDDLLLPEEKKTPAVALPPKEKRLPAAAPKHRDRPVPPPPPAETTVHNAPPQPNPIAPAATERAPPPTVEPARMATVPSEARRSEPPANPPDATPRDLRLTTESVTGPPLTTSSKAVTFLTFLSMALALGFYLLRLLRRS